MGIDFIDKTDNPNLEIQIPAQKEKPASGADVELQSKDADNIREIRRKASIDLAQRMASGDEDAASAEIIRTIKSHQTIEQEVLEEVPFVKYNRVPTSVSQVEYSPQELIQTHEKLTVSGSVEQNKNSSKRITDLYEHDPETEIIVEVPHIQRRVRTNVIPEYEEEPMLIDVPMVQIRAVPKEYIIDRTVPIPVEVSIVQEILCPELIPEYEDIPVPVHVTRVTEKPVPQDALISDTVLKAAITWHDMEVTKRKPNLQAQPPHLHRIMEDSEPKKEVNTESEA